MKPRLNLWPLMGILIILLSFSGIVWLALWLAIKLLCRGIGVR